MPSAYVGPAPLGTSIGPNGALVGPFIKLLIESITLTADASVAFAAGQGFEAEIALIADAAMAFQRSLTAGPTLTLAADAGVLFDVPDLIVALQDRQDLWKPRWLFRILDVGGVTKRFSEVDVETTPFYDGRIENAEQISVRRSLSEEFWGPVQIQDVSVTLANADGALTADFLLDLRGKLCALDRYDLFTGTTVNEFSGIIFDIKLWSEHIQIDARNVNVAVFRELIPKGIIDTTIFPKAVDLGKTPQVVFGNVPRVPLWYIRDDPLAEVAFFDVSSANNGTGATSLTISKPAGTVQNHVMVANLFFSGGTAVTITPPSGWTLIRRDDSGTTIGMASYFLVAGVSEPATYQWTWTASASQRAAGIIQDFVNVDTASPVDVSNGIVGPSDTSIECPNVTITAPALLICAYGINSDGGGNLQAEAGQLKRAETAATTLRLMVTTEKFNVVGATGSNSATAAGGAAVNIGHAIALRPAIPYPYEYGAIRGAVSLTQLFRDGPNNTLFLIGVDEYVVSTTLYAGYTVARFPVRQTNFQGAFHRLWADVTGLQTERNWARAAETIFSNATYFLGLTTDSASFAAGAGVIDQIGGLFCDFAISEPEEAQDILREIFMVRGMRPTFDETGKWGLSVDKKQNTIRMDLFDGVGDGERNIVDIGERGKPRLDEQVKVLRLKYRPDLSIGPTEFKFEQIRTVDANRGTDKPLSFRSIRDHTTADKTAHYLGQRFKRNERVKVVVPQEGRKLFEGHLIRLTHSQMSYAQAILQIERVEKGEGTIGLDLREWNADIHDPYVPGTLPTDDITATPSDYSRTPPNPVTNLSVVGSGTEQAGDGTTVAFVTIQYTTPTVNYDRSVVSIRLAGTTPWHYGYGFSSGILGTIQLKLTGLTAGQNYDVTVEVINSFGLVSAGNPLITAQLAPNDTGTVSAPTGVAARQSGAKVIEIDVTYTPPKNWGTIQLFRNTTNNSASATKIQEGKQLRFHDENVSYGTTYFYWAKATNRTGTASAFSPVSNSVTVQQIQTADVIDAGITNPKRALLGVFTQSVTLVANSQDVVSFAHGQSTIPQVHAGFLNGNTSQLGVTNVVADATTITVVVRNFGTVTTWTRTLEVRYF